MVFQGGMVEKEQTHAEQRRNVTTLWRATAADDARQPRMTRDRHGRRTFRTVTHSACPNAAAHCSAVMRFCGRAM